MHVHLWRWAFGSPNLNIIIIIPNESHFAKFNAHQSYPLYSILPHSPSLPPHPPTHPPTHPHTNTLIVVLWHHIDSRLISFCLEVICFMTTSPPVRCCTRPWSYSAITAWAVDLAPLSCAVTPPSTFNIQSQLVKYHRTDFNCKYLLIANCEFFLHLQSIDSQTYVYTIIWYGVNLHN